MAKSYSTGEPLVAELIVGTSKEIEQSLEFKINEVGTVVGIGISAGAQNKVKYRELNQNELDVITAKSKWFDSASFVELVQREFARVNNLELNTPAEQAELDLRRQLTNAICDSLYGIPVENLNETQTRLVHRMVDAIVPIATMKLPPVTL